MKHLYVCRSKIHGLGINMGEPVKQGEIISRTEGEIKFKVNKDKKDALDNPDWVGIEKNQWIDPRKPYKFLNHSCNPSAGVRGRTIIATRDMKEGDEITIDYSTIEGDPLWEMKCSCGLANCRKTIRSVQFLPKQIFNKYLPNIPAYFRKLYAHRTKTIKQQS